MVARWSASKPCFTPSTKMSRHSAWASCGNIEIAPLRFTCAMLPACGVYELFKDHHARKHVWRQWDTRIRFSARRQSIDNGPSAAMAADAAGNAWVRMEANSLAELSAGGGRGRRGPRAA